MDFVTDGQVHWHPMPDPYDIFVYPDFRFEVPVGRDRYLAQLQERFPSEATMIDRYFRDVERATEWMGLQMVRKAMPRWMSPFTRLVGPKRKALALQTTKQYLENVFVDPRLRALLGSQWPDYGLSPEESAFGIHALVTSSYFDGAYYPAGGAQTIAKAFLHLLEARGGTCLVNREATEILIENGRATGVRVIRRAGTREEEEVYRAPVVISNVGAVPTWLKLVPRNVPVPFRDEVRAFPHGHSAVTLYVGLKEHPSRLGVKGENYWIYTSLDHDAARRDRAAVLEGKPRFGFLSFPSAKDPKAKYHTAEIIAIVDYESFEKWKDSEWKHRPDTYDQLKESVSRGLLALSETILPGFTELVEYTELSTPLSMEHFTSRPFGAFYGVPAIPKKYTQSWMDVETPVGGLYLAGSDVASLGIMGAAVGGAVAAGKIMGIRGFAKVMQLLCGPR
jgi:phytoene dehydrogenase-like protein